MSLNMGMVMGRKKAAAGGTPSWVLVSGSGEEAVWDADFANNRFWFDGTQYFTVAAFFDAMGVTFTRADAVATFFGSNQRIQTTPANDTPRLTFKPSDGSGQGLLMEGAATNLCLESEAISTSPWSVAAATVTTNALVAPDGASTADDLIMTGGGAVEQPITVTADAIFTYSAYIKQGTTGEHDWCRMRYVDNGTVNGVEAWFDLTSNGDVGTSQTRGTGATLIGTRTEILDDSWFKVSLIGQLPSAETAARVRFGNAPSDGSGAGATDASVAWWGLSLVQGSFPTSYVPTTTAAVTRAAEVCVSTLSGSPDIPFTGWDTDKGTMVVEWTQGDIADATIKHVFTIQDAGNDTEESVIIRVDTNDIQGGLTDGATESLIEITDAAALDTKVKAAFSWIVNNTAFVVDAGTVGTDDTSTIRRSWSGLGAMWANTRNCTYSTMRRMFSSLVQPGCRCSTLDPVGWACWCASTGCSPRCGVSWLSRAPM